MRLLCLRFVPPQHPTANDDESAVPVSSRKDDEGAQVRDFFAFSATCERIHFWVRKWVRGLFTPFFLIGPSKDGGPILCMPVHIGGIPFMAQLCFVPAFC